MTEARRMFSEEARNEFRNIGVLLSIIQGQQADMLRRLERLEGYVSTGNGDPPLRYAVRDLRIAVEALRGWRDLVERQADLLEQTRLQTATQVRTAEIQAGSQIKSVATQSRLMLLGVILGPLLALLLGYFLARPLAPEPPRPVPPVEHVPR